MSDLAIVLDNVGCRCLLASDARSSFNKTVIFSLVHLRHWTLSDTHVTVPRVFIYSVSRLYSGRVCLVPRGQRILLLRLIQNEDVVISRD